MLFFCRLDGILQQCSMNPHWVFSQISSRPSYVSSLYTAWKFYSNLRKHSVMLNGNICEGFCLVKDEKWRFCYWCLVKEAYIGYVTIWDFSLVLKIFNVCPAISPNCSASCTFFCFCDNAYHKQEVCFLLCSTDHLVTWCSDNVLLLMVKIDRQKGSWDSKSQKTHCYSLNSKKEFEKLKL